MMNPSGWAAPWPYTPSKGVEIHLMCATKGEAGEVDPEFLEGFDSIASRRESELLCAAEHLGLAKVHFMGYRDSGMQGSEDNQHPQAFINAPLEKVAGEVVAYIREFQPDLVLTFDPVGGYHHPDHIHIQKAATIAFEAAGDPDQYPTLGQPFQPDKLYYHVFPRRFHARGRAEYCVCWEETPQNSGATGISTWPNWPGTMTTRHMYRSITKSKGKERSGQPVPRQPDQLQHAKPGDPAAYPPAEYQKRYLHAGPAGCRRELPRQGSIRVMCL